MGIKEKKSTLDFHNNSNDNHKIRTKYHKTVIQYPQYSDNVLWTENQWWGYDSVGSNLNTKWNEINLIPL